jgi:PST family polysaccharide transporter
MLNKIIQIKNKLLSHKIIIENYIFMTILQLLNSMFYFIIYPYLIKNLGLDSYGLYVFSMSIVNYFMSIVSFGFDFPAVNEISKNYNDDKMKAHILSCIFTAKIYLEIASMLVFGILIITIPSFLKNWVIYLILFANTFVTILFPNWYFQGIQKMRIVTYIQLFFKILSLPFIFLLVHNSNDLWVFTLIITLSNVSGGIVAYFMITIKEKLKIEWMPFSEVKNWYKDALPFFWSNAGAMIKQQSIAVIIGSFFNMRDVALYDLAYKIISIPMVLFGSINGALFPKIARDNNKKVVKKVLFYELIAGVLAIVSVVFLGKDIIVLLGGEKMLSAYPIAVVLSFGLITFLLVGAYISFIFVPQKKYYLVTQNQVVAFVIFFALVGVGLLIWKNILAIAFAWSFAQIFEIIYCNYLLKKHKLF